MLNLLLMAVMTQVPEAPETSLITAGTPLISKSGTVDLKWHTVSMNLDKEQAKVNCVSLFHNTSDKPVDAEVLIPVHIQGWSTNYGTNMKVLWADSAVKPVRTFDEDSEMNGIRQSTRWYVYKVSFRPNAQRSLKTEMILPIQITGPDAMERAVGYRFNSTGVPLETMSLSIKYPQELVYRTIGAAPQSWGWQIGPRGTFVKRDNVSLNAPTLATFRYYRGGFDKIGDGQ